MANITITTKQNDSFPLIAFNVYGEEKMANVIAAANPQYTNVLIFDEGITLTIPIVDVVTNEDVPPWRR